MPNITDLFILLQVPDSAILECKEFTDTSGKGFIDQHADKTVKLDKTNWEASVDVKK